MKTGMLAAEAAFAALAAGRGARRARPPIRRRCASRWLYEELHKVRNFKPGLKWGMWAGHAAWRHRHVAERSRARRAVPWTLRHDKADHDIAAAGGGDAADRLPEARRRAHVRRLSSVFVSNTNHEEDQPVAPAAAGPGDPGDGQSRRCTTAPSSATARPASTSSSPRDDGAASACRSTRRTACTARPATSRTRRRTSTGSRPKAAAGRTIPNM